LIFIQKHSSIPKYKQIIASIELALENGKLKRGDQIPSVNNISTAFSLSRDTVLQGYNELKMRGVIRSVPGKGYYVKSQNTKVRQKVFLLFDELNAFKENLYNSFIAGLDNSIEVDIFFHHFNPEVFNDLIYNNAGNYNYYVIMPANISDTVIAINTLPKKQVYILDQFHEDLSEYSAIYQNFKEDMYHFLNKVNSSIKKYKKFVFTYDKNKQPDDMLYAFQKFCTDFSMEHEVIQTVNNHEIKKRTIYLIPDDRNLILIIKKIKKTNFTIGKDIGIISYNETLLKEIVDNGITTISTDFEFMGKRLAAMIQNKEKIQIKNPSSIIIRNSL
jgi:DNA-binding transcriptional regulator YhcF (GntR family)